MVTSPTSSNTDDKTASGFASLHIVTTACHGVLNTNFTAPSPKPDWFDDLSQKLDSAKVLANQWIDDIAPKITASIPTHVINYGTTYDAITDQIVELLDENPLAKGKDDPTIQQVSALIQALEQEASQIIGEIEETQTQLKTWGDAMQKAHDDLFNGAAAIQNAEADLQADIDKMNNAIAGLRTQIDEQNKIIAGMGAMIGIGLLALVVGIALAPVTGGASLIVAGIGGLAVVGGAVTWGVMQDKINDEFDEIAKDQQRLNDDQRQLVALQGLSLSANAAISSIAIATSTLSDVKTMWTVFQNEIQGTIDKLEKADEALIAIVKKADVLAAQKEWKLAVQFAEQLVGMNVSVESKELPMAA
jgi:Bacillus haemolytic enterotoxin (HBL)